LNKTRLESPGRKDLGAYIEFLEETGAFRHKTLPARNCPSDFEL